MPRQKVGAPQPAGEYAPRVCDYQGPLGDEHTIVYIVFRRAVGHTLFTIYTGLWWQVVSNLNMEEQWTPG